MIIPRRHLGTTRSGKLVFLYATDDERTILAQIADYELADNFDAYCMFQCLIIDAVRRYGLDSEEAHRLVAMGNLHLKTLTASFIEREKRLLSLHTSIAIAVYGKSLLHPLLAE